MKNFLLNSSCICLFFVTSLYCLADGKRSGTNILECRPRNKDLSIVRLLWEDRSTQVMIETSRWINGMERQQSQKGVLNDIQFNQLGIPFSNPERPGKISSMKVETEGAISLSIAVKQRYSDAIVTSELNRFHYPKGVRVSCIYLHEEADE